MFLIYPWEWVGLLGKLIKVSHRGLVWCPRTLTFHVESSHQNKLYSMIFQYTSMANEVHLNGTNKMRDFSNNEGICIHLFRYRFLKLVTIIHGSVHLEMYLIQYLNNVACTCMDTIGFLCTCLHSLLGTLGTCCIACTQCIMTPLTKLCMLTFAPLSNSNLTHSMCPAFEAFISAVHPPCNDKCISSWEYHQYQIHTTHQSDREYTRTSPTHSSTTHSTNTKKAPLGGTFSAPSCPMMSYTANILLPIPKKTNPIPPSGYCTPGLGQ